MKKRLTRRQETKVVAGVLSGLAHYFEQDPMLFRLAAVFMLIVTGVFPGLLMYVIAWFVLPRDSAATYHHTIDS